MSISERKRQKQLARKRRKRKQKKASMLTSIGSAFQTARNAAEAAQAPINECLVPEELFENGLGTIVISRTSKDGNIAASVILLDVYCLGAKNAYFQLLSPAEYRSRLDAINTHETLKLVHPTCARKLVEEGVAYARNIGFDPHPDYKIAKQIFGDIEAGACPEKYEFGKDGKPLFVAGPNDDMKKSRKIIDTLQKTCGPDGFNYLVGFPEI